MPADVSPADVSPASVGPARFGLAIKLFAVLLLLGAIGVLITGVVGHLRAREALQQTIFNQMTAMRETKANQIETYFRSIRGEMRVLAGTKMAVDAKRGFGEATAELDRLPVPKEVRDRVDGWYEGHFVPAIRHLVDDVPVKEFLPAGPAPYFLQDWYIVSNPYLAVRRKLLDNAGDGSTYSRIHAIYHPLMRTAATTLGFADFMMVDHKTHRVLDSVEKEPDFGLSLIAKPYLLSNVAAAASRCGSSRADGAGATKVSERPARPTSSGPTITFAPRHACSSRIVTPTSRVLPVTRRTRTSPTFASSARRS